MLGEDGGGVSVHGINTCEDHDDCIVIYTGRKCPVCSIVEDATNNHDEDMVKIGQLKDEIEEMENAE